MNEPRRSITTAALKRSALTETNLASTAKPQTAAPAVPFTQFDYYHEDNPLRYRNRKDLKRYLSKYGFTKSYFYKLHIF